MFSGCLQLKWLNILFLFLLSGRAFAQKVEVLQRTAFRAPVASKSFIYWEPATDTTALSAIAVLRATGIGPDAEVEALFERIKAKAQSLGANAFKPSAFVDEDKKTVLTLNVYYAPEAAIPGNSANQENNVVYIFGRLKSSEKSMAFTFNGEKMELKDGSYYRYPLGAGETVQIRKGGFIGTSAAIQNQTDTSARFLSLSGMSVSVPPTMPGVSAIAVSSGGITPLNKSFGRMLTALLRQTP